MHYKEEILALQAEKKYICISLEKDALKWEVHQAQGCKKTKDPILQESLTVYALKKATFLRCLKSKFHDLWFDTSVSYRSFNFNTNVDEGIETEIGDEAVRFSFIDDDSDREWHNECRGCALFFAFPCLFLASAYCHSATHIVVTWTSC
jgi:hypothetical protein